jgi:putative cardiolipin synthase
VAFASLCGIASATPATPGSAGKVAALYDRLAPGKPALPTQVRILSENAAAWYARWWALQSAEETIDVQYFTLEPDILGKALLGLLLEKARAGVEVRLMLDARGSKRLARRIHQQAFLQELAEYPNATVRVFRPWHKNLLEAPLSLRNLVASNHDKLILVDGKRAVLGGRNLWHPYFMPDGSQDTTSSAVGGGGRWQAGYRDRDIMVEGASVGPTLGMAFDREWESQSHYQIGKPWFGDWRDQSIELDLARQVVARWSAGNGPTPPVGKHGRLIARLNDEVATLRHIIRYPAFAAQPWQGGRTVECKFLDKTSYHGGHNDITPSLLAALDAAEERIYFQHAYVILTDEVKAALVRAAARGVDIVIHTNGPNSSDSKIVQGPLLYEWKSMLADIPTLRLYMETGPRLVHAKTVVIDDAVAGIGSYNLDPMSQDLNGELLAFIRSPEMALELRQEIDADLTQATRCEIRIEPDGTVVGVVGPDKYLRGATGLWIYLLSKLRFLRPIL